MTANLSRHRWPRSGDRRSTNSLRVVPRTDRFLPASVPPAVLRTYRIGRGRQVGNRKISREARSRPHDPGGGTERASQPGGAGASTVFRYAMSSTSIAKYSPRWRARTNSIAVSESARMSR